MAQHGRDPRRQASMPECRLIYERAQGRCQRCGAELGPDYHNAHLIAWSNGGATTVEQMQAWCADCNLGLGAHDVGGLDGIDLRDWQARALPRILRRLWQNGSATLHAASGAGKTLFAGLVFRRLHDEGQVERLVVLVPNKALVRQWKSHLGALGIHVDDHPRYGAIEDEGLRGVVATYQSLPGAAGVHATRLEQRPTLVIFDEVHHVATLAAWGHAVRRMVGDVTGDERRSAAVLNMTGTLFRSSSKRRISTVRYDHVLVEGVPKLQAVADFSIATPDLIGIELRAPDLLAYGGHAHLIDVLKEKIVDADIADLDDSQHRAAVRWAYSSREWMEGFAREAVRVLQTQLEAIDHAEPLKLLFLTPSQRAARHAADALNKVTGQDFARLVTSDRPEALRTLRRAAQEPYPCAIVAIKMITEGFDCPQVSTIAYATNVLAPLFISQMMARAMRITATERADHHMLPAKILIPDNEMLRKAFATALANATPPVDEEEEAPNGGPGPGGIPRMPRYELLDLDDPRLRSATVLDQDDGEVEADELARYVAQCRKVGIPETYAPRVAVVSRRYRPPLHTYALEDDRRSTSTPGGAPTGAETLTVTAAGPHALNHAHRKRIAHAVGWMCQHLDHDSRYPSIAVFQAMANAAAGVQRGEREHASAEQLSIIEDWMMSRIGEHCGWFDEPVPSWDEGGDPP